MVERVNCSGRTESSTGAPAPKPGRSGQAYSRAGIERDRGGAAVQGRDPAVQQVGRADEAVDEKRLRPVVDRHRRIELLDLALVHHGDAVGDAHRLVLIVGHQDGGEAELALQPLDLDLHVEPEVAVERGERLVEQQDRGLDGQRAGERHPLLLAARQLARQALAEAAELDDVEEARDARRQSRAHACRGRAGRKLMFSTTVMCGK